MSVENRSSAAYFRALSGNADADSINIMVAELQKQSAQNRLLFVLSDGMPTGNTEQDVKETVELAKKNGVKVFSIFFASSQSQLDEFRPKYKDMYGTNIVATSPDKIAVEAVRLMKKELF